MKVARRCQCSRNCRHLARGSDALLPAERLVQLEPMLSTLIDAAAGYDDASLIFDPACGVHGERSVSNVECSCRGEPTSALEFIQALILDVRSARVIAQNRPAGQPHRRRDGTMRLVASG